MDCKITLKNIFAIKENIEIELPEIRSAETPEISEHHPDSPIVCAIRYAGRVGGRIANAVVYVYAHKIHSDVSSRTLYDYLRIAQHASHRAHLRLYKVFVLCNSRGADAFRL